MELEIHITLRFDLAIGKVGLNEIVYKLKELRNDLMLKIRHVSCYSIEISQNVSKVRFDGIRQITEMGSLTK